MSKWQTLLVKEIVHLFRDTKTIVQTVVVPTFITPLLIGAVIWYISSIAVDEGKKTYEVAVYIFEMIKNFFGRDSCYFPPLCLPFLFLRFLL